MEAALIVDDKLKLIVYMIKLGVKFIQVFHLISFSSNSTNKSRKIAAIVEANEISNSHPTLLVTSRESVI